MKYKWIHLDTQKSAEDLYLFVHGFHPLAEKLRAKRAITAESTAKLKAPSLLSSRISSRFLLVTLCTPLFLCVYSRFSITPPSGRAQRFWLGRTHCSACQSTAISRYRSESVIIPYSKMTAHPIPVWFSTTRQHTHSLF